MDPFFRNQEKLVRKLYKDVSNMVEFRKYVLTAGLPICLLKPKLILDDFQLTVAITKTLYNQKEGTMKTKTFPTELIYCLSPLRKINESLQTFGVGENDTEVLIVGEASSYEEVIKPSIKAQEISIDELSNYSDTTAIKELYGISEEELSGSSLLDSVISKVSTKDYL